MAGRIRTTKKLSQRIDREYFKRLYPIPRWRRILSIGLSVIGLAWVGWSSVVGTGEVFNAGPLSKKHHLLEGNCTTCHSASSSFGVKVTDASCTSCHDGPTHQVQQMFEPACTSCHIEHKGLFQLASVNDASCSQCHGALQTKDGKLNIEARVTSFGSHPEFVAAKAGAQDPGTIKLNHEVHMKADLRGPNGPQQLQCASCHVKQPDGVMKKVNYKDNCASCHPLEFYAKINDVLPHDKPDVVFAFARQQFQRYISANPGDVNLADPPVDPRIMTPRPGPAGNAAEWMRRRMEDLPTLLWRKTCVECHNPTTVADPNSRTIPEAKIADVWMTKAKFDHNPHQMVECASCHDKAATSKETADVLLPGVESCRGCHNTGASGADASCSECHVYHDWSKAKQIVPKFTIEQLLH